MVVQVPIIHVNNLVRMGISYSEILAAIMCYSHDEEERSELDFIQFVMETDDEIFARFVDARSSFSFVTDRNQ